jgi:holo-[acyl-carrier protein] synthase
MSLLGIGVDILHIPRFRALVTRRTAERVAARILSSQEHLTFKELPTGKHEARLRFLAVRWAVKEATYKALYPTAVPTWGMVTYHSANRAVHLKPSLEFSGELTSMVGTGARHVSVSHDGDYVLAQVQVYNQVL